MELDEAIIVTQDKLAIEGDSIGDLLPHFRSFISPNLIGDAQWHEILSKGKSLPITLAALPFGFELPLHEAEPKADLGVSLASRTRTAALFNQRAQEDPSDKTAQIIARLFRQIDSNESILEDIVGRKLMLEFDIGSARSQDGAVPGMFLRPGEKPIVGAAGQIDDVSLIVDALVSSVGWERNDQERDYVKLAYSKQPADTRMDSFGVFPSRERFIRLAVMGFKTPAEVSDYLDAIRWPGELSAVEDVIVRFNERTNIVRCGTNIDVSEHGIGPSLGLTLVVKQRYTNEARYWLDGLTDWDPFLDALAHEPLVGQAKLKELASWVTKPTTLFGKSGRFMLLRGIHHIKLVIEDNTLSKAKAYVFMVLTAGL
ncbi:MAG: hypothetical protein F4W90_08815 [Gammaproteobacteria bacterium]|nr:hypothetical protein [Gammaproteobacteria bacterium]